jgi:hypothetical protein
MLVFSMKLTKKKIFAALFAAAVMLAIIIAATSGWGGTSAPAGADAPENVLAATNDQRIEFLKYFGLNPNPDPVEIIEVIIPSEFDETYEGYNNLQKSAGFDLAGQKGKKVKKWTYELIDFPGSSSPVQATLLVLDGKVVGGDIAETAVGGFQRSLNNK